MRLTQELIRELLDYNPGTGALTWRYRARKLFKADRYWKCWNTRYAGTLAGSRNDDGYYQIKMSKRSYLAHRVVWLWMTGKWPDEEIDHINHNRTDNSWANLRSVTRAENFRNLSRPSNNTSGTVGVTWDPKAGKWKARIRGNAKTLELGYYVHNTDAIAARERANRKFGYHSNHGR